jgi:ATP-dependent DNA helicase RecQ
MGRPPTIAVTATATPETRQDVVRVLGLRRPVRVLQSFDRPNLFFAVRHCQDHRSRLRILASLLEPRHGSAIVYVPTRNQSDGVATVLRQWGYPALPYHAGLPGAARRSLLARFLDGRLGIIVATNAFGMGIDQPNVRLVAHLGVPPRPEAYFQEAGRAGRDGRPARCVMLWTPGDVALAWRLGRCRPGQPPASEPLRAARRRGLGAMHRYLTTRGCRRRVLLEYLGEHGGGCAGCDGCSGGSLQPDG